MVLVPGRRVIEGDFGVISGRWVGKNNRSLLQSVVQDGQVLLDHHLIGRGKGIARIPPAAELGCTLLFLEHANPLPVGREGGLDIVQEGLPDGLWRELLVVTYEVDGGRRGPLGALVQEDLGEGVGREGGRVGEEELLLLAYGRVFPRVHEDAGRGLDLPGAEVDGLAVGDGGGRGETGLLEPGEELGGVVRAEVGRREVGRHGLEDGGLIVAELVVELREVERGREVQGVGDGVGREEHDVGQLRGEADLADARDDLVQPGGGLGSAGGLG